MKNQNLVKFVLMAFFLFLCGNISAQSSTNGQEKYLDKMVAKYKNNSSYRHISVLGCNLGNTYAVFSQNLKKKGFKLVRSWKDGYLWKGKLSGRDVGLQIDCCGKYILDIHMEFACESEEDENNTFRNLLGSLTKKYGDCTRVTRTTNYWEKTNYGIELYSTSGNGIVVKGKKTDHVFYKDLIYLNWIKQYDKQVKNQKLKQEKKVFDSNL